MSEPTINQQLTAIHIAYRIIMGGIPMPRGSQRETITAHMRAAMDTLEQLKSEKGENRALKK